jgi:hypothetical protein
LITHGRIGNYETIEPVGWHELTPAEFDNPVRLQLRWVSGNAFEDRIILQPELESEAGERLLVDLYVGLNRGQVPGQFNFLSLNLSVSSDMKNRAEIAVAQRPRRVEITVRGTELAFLLDGAEARYQ